MRWLGVEESFLGEEEEEDSFDLVFLDFSFVLVELEW